MPSTIIAFGPIVGVVIGYALAGGFRRTPPPPYFSTIVNTAAPSATEVTAALRRRTIERGFGDV